MAITSVQNAYGTGQNMTVMPNVGSSDSLVAMLGSCSSHVGLQVPRPMLGGLEDAVVGCGQKRPYYWQGYEAPTVEEAEDVDDAGDDSSPRAEKKRRLTFDQVRSLERNFELENKLEPERKMQLAKELGLQPRQVAVWFQNRRARWKTKQLERDYELLNMDYNKLKAAFDVAVGEKNNLKAQLLRLSGNTQSEKSLGENQFVELAQVNGETSVHPTQVKAERSNDFVLPRKHRVSGSSPTVDISSAHKEKEESLSSDDSSSSDILDADSPRTTDSSSLSMISEDQTVPASQEFPPESFVGPDMLQVSDEYLSTPDGTNFHEDQSCKYFLPQLLDEQSVLPWWDWP